MAILSVVSEMYPIKGVHRAPPIIAITRIEPPIFVFLPSPLMLEAKMVGYINDIKKLVKKMAHIPIQPGTKMPIPTRMTLTRL